MTAFEDTLRGVFGLTPDQPPPVVTVTGDAVLVDPADLRAGDRAVLIITGDVVEAGAGADLRLQVDGGPPWTFNPGQLSVSAVQVGRVRRPLPPEVIPGREVLGESSGCFWRHVACEPGADCPPPCAGHYWTCAGLIGRYTWAEVLEREGSVRLLGDPIEAPR